MEFVSRASGVAGIQAQGGVVRLGFGFLHTGLFVLSFPVTGIELHGNPLDRLIGVGFVFHLRHGVLDAVGKTFVVLVSEDAWRILKLGSEAVELDVIPDDPPCFRHAEIVELFFRLSAWVDSSEVGAEFGNEGRPGIKPFRLFVVQGGFYNMGFKPLKGGALKISQCKINPLTFVEVILFEIAEIQFALENESLELLRVGTVKLIGFPNLKFSSARIIVAVQYCGNGFCNYFAHIAISVIPTISVVPIRVGGIVTSISVPRWVWRSSRRWRVTFGNPRKRILIRCRPFMTR